MKLFEIVHKKTGQKIYNSKNWYVWSKKNKTLFDSTDINKVFEELKKSLECRDAFEFGLINYYEVSAVEETREPVIEIYVKGNGKELFKTIKKKSGVELISFMRKCENYKTSIQRAILNYVFELRAKERLEESE